MPKIKHYTKVTSKNLRYLFNSPRGNLCMRSSKKKGSYEQLLTDKDSLLGIVIFVVMTIIFNAVVLKDLIKDIFSIKKK